MKTRNESMQWNIENIVIIVIKHLQMNQIERIEYSFIAITLKLSLNGNGSTCQDPIYRLNRSV